jgi:hypothetical protein
VHPRQAATAATAATFASVGLLHVAWGFGSTFPMASATELADAVAGFDAVQPPVACFAVAGLLGVAGALVADVARLPRSLRRPGLVGLSTVLALRAAAGFAGRTDRLVGWPTSDRFRRNDRRYFAPLCAALAVGTVVSLPD